MFVSSQDSRLAALSDADVSRTFLKHMQPWQIILTSDVWAQVTRLQDAGLPYVRDLGRFSVQKDQDLVISVLEVRLVLVCFGALFRPLLNNPACWHPAPPASRAQVGHEASAASAAPKAQDDQGDGPRPQSLPDSDALQDPTAYQQGAEPPCCAAPG